MLASPRYEALVRTTPGTVPFATTSQVPAVNEHHWGAKATWPFPPAENMTVPVGEKPKTVATQWTVRLKSSAVRAQETTVVLCVTPPGIKMAPNRTTAISTITRLPLERLRSDISDQAPFPLFPPRCKEASVCGPHQRPPRP